MRARRIPKTMNNTTIEMKKKNSIFRHSFRTIHKLKRKENTTINTQKRRSVVVDIELHWILLARSKFDFDGPVGCCCCLRLEWWVKFLSDVSEEARSFCRAKIEKEFVGEEISDGLEVKREPCWVPSSYWSRCVGRNVCNVPERDEHFIRDWTQIRDKSPVSRRKSSSL